MSETLQLPDLSDPAVMARVVAALKQFPPPETEQERRFREARRRQGIARVLRTEITI